MNDFLIMISISVPLMFVLGALLKISDRLKDIDEALILLQEKVKL